jgi:hypothetical protein
VDALLDGPFGQILEMTLADAPERAEFFAAYATDLLPDKNLKQWFTHWTPKVFQRYASLLCGGAPRDVLSPYHSYLSLLRLAICIPDVSPRFADCRCIIERLVGCAVQISDVSYR